MHVGVDTPPGMSFGVSARPLDCRTYIGPMSAAVYLPLVQPEEDGTRELSSSNAARVKSEVSRLGRIFNKCVGPKSQFRHSVKPEADLS